MCIDLQQMAKMAGGTDTCVTRVRTCIAMQMAKKEEVLELLATEGPMEAGLVISFVKDVPPEDDRFHGCFGDGR